MTTSNLILLVEDNADDELLALRAFRKNGLANPVIVARDGQETPAGPFAFPFRLWYSISSASMNQVLP